METYCRTCGEYDTKVQTQDNAFCKECGDTEGLVTISDLEHFFSTTNYNSISPNSYLEIYAPDEYLARIASYLKLGKGWAFIYTGDRLDEQVRSYGIRELPISPIIVREHERNYLEQKFKEAKEVEA